MTPAGRLRNISLSFHRFAEAVCAALSVLALSYRAPLSYLCQNYAFLAGIWKGPEKYSLAPESGRGAAAFANR
jgi:hypothetical protein